MSLHGAYSVTSKAGNKNLLSKGSYHNSKPVKVGKPSLRGGGGLGFYLVFPNLEVGKWFFILKKTF